MPDFALSPHFTFQELTASEIALRHGIANVPGEQEIENLRYLASMLEQVRALLGHPIHVNSGFRCLAVNALVGSKPTSAHVKGLAADIVCPEFGPPQKIVDAIVASAIDYDQVIVEYDRWVHIGFAPAGETNRRQKLVINGLGHPFS